MGSDGLMSQVAAVGGDSGGGGVGGGGTVNLALSQSKLMQGLETGGVVLGVGT